MEPTVFTPTQIHNYVEYENVRDEGAYNMRDYRARMATGLTELEFLFTLRHYSELRKQYESHSKE